MIDALFNLPPYLRWEIIFVFVPSLIIWAFFGSYLIKYKKIILKIAVASFVWGLVFDLVASPTLGVWHFHPTENLRITFLGLPIEEYVFLTFVPQELTSILLLVKKILADD